MARNGSGTFSRVHDFTDDRDANIKIEASRMDAELDGIATALTDSIAKDGQTTPTANLPMGGFLHTNVADGTARNHYASLGQAQDGGATYATAGGTANVITLTLSPAITAYAAGQRFSFKAAADNTGAVTLNVNAVGAKAIQKRGAALVSGDIKDGHIVLVEYDGVQFQMLSPATIGTTEIIDDAVTSAKIADDAVGTAQIADDAVTAAQIADDAVDTAQIVDEAVTTDKIADAAVTAAKIAARVCFSAHKNGTDQTGINAGADIDVTFGTEDFDVGGHYNTTTSKWTPPAGKVRVTAQIRWTGTLTDTSEYTISIITGTSTTLARRGVRASGTGSAYVAVTAVIEVDGSQTIGVQCNSSSDSNKISGTAIETFFCGEVV